MLTWVSAATLKKAKAVASVRRKTYIGKHVGALLGKAWNDYNVTIPHRVVPEVDKAGKPEHRECLEAHMCLCDEDGKRRKSIASRVDAFTKATFKRADGSREDLVNGMVVFVFLGEHFVGAGDDAPEIVEHPELQAFHVGDHELKPYKPHYHYALPSAALAFHRETGTLTALDPIPLQAMGEFFTKCQALRRLNLALRWRVCHLKLVSNDSLLGRFLPCEPIGFQY